MTAPDPDTADLLGRDYFADPDLVDDPYPYFDALRTAGPVHRLPLHGGVVAVTGYDEACAVYRDRETFSSCNSVVGPFAPFPVPLEGDDVSALVLEHRHHMPAHELLITLDPPEHTRERALLMRLLTPKRLQDNEEFMARLADDFVDRLVAVDGPVEILGTFARPFSMYVVADLLGVPEEDHLRFAEGFGLLSRPGEVGAGAEGNPADNPLGWLDEAFAAYVEDRRRAPRDDVLTHLARATYPDGSTPEVVAVVRIATLLFAAGQETSARLVASALLHLAEHPDTQDAVRADPALINPLLEEVLRTESPVKTDFRLALRRTTLGGVEIAAGTPVMLLNGAANRDPRRFGCPADVQVDRENAQAHIAFGRGAHACPGGPLARAEGRICLERILGRTSAIRLSEAHHGPPGDRRVRYEPTWLLRGLSGLHLELDAVPPGGGDAAAASAPAG